MSVQPEVGEPIIFPNDKVIHSYDWEEKDDLRRQAREAFDDEHISYKEYTRILRATESIAERKLEEMVNDVVVRALQQRERMLKWFLVILSVILIAQMI